MVHAGLAVGRVQVDVGEADVVQRPGAEGGEFGVQVGTERSLCAWQRAAWSTPFAEAVGMMRWRLIMVYLGAYGPLRPATARGTGGPLSSGRRPRHPAGSCSSRSEVPLERMNGRRVQANQVRGRNPDCNSSRVPSSRAPLGVHGLGRRSCRSRRWCSRLRVAPDTLAGEPHRAESQAVHRQVGADRERSRYGGGQCRHVVLQIRKGAQLSSLGGSAALVRGGAQASSSRRSTNRSQLVLSSSVPGGTTLKVLSSQPSRCGRLTSKSAAMPRDSSRMYTTDRA
ncbi:hypothetical protein STSP_62570 [Streptomyces jeddahensis]|uniref:Uncharacterized protein n=1 Tax=Streptomyces jeddahensis TaxID=1716141 RepID=A0A177HJJ7_9ACTN|nr:hypothetical protein STSP_62570 [Streptomyces jeddahensis]